MGHKPLTNMKIATRERELFWSHVDKSGDCWLWTAHRAHYGHGLAKIDGHTVHASRVMWEIVNGPIPEGLWVLHSCDNPPCVRPEHLHLGTIADNMREASLRHRMATGQRHGSRTHPESIKRGEQNAAAKLTEESVRTIRAMRSDGIRLRVIAEKYKVSISSVCDVARGHTWKHVT